MFWSQLVNLILLSLVNISHPQSAPPVQTTSGQIVGQNMTVNGQQYAVFLGIPYAQPPIGALRFQLPVAINGSKATINATKYSNVCTQLNSTGNGVQGAEDCLYLNVFTVSLPTTQRLPVMVFIHGGAFIIGSGVFPAITSLLQNIVSNGVLFVSLNYRLGAFGFWSTLSATARGNLGFFDQLMVLQWVQSNIAQFGGDPTRVTIIGQSAGAASVSAHTLSPLSRGLFHQSIMMSGSMFGPPFLNNDTLMYTLYQQFEGIVGCPQRGQVGNTTADLALVQCMQSVAPNTLVLTRPSYVPADTTSIWTPRIDGLFLPSSVPTLASSRPPLNSIIGTTKNEFASLTLAAVALGEPPEPIVISPALLVNESLPDFIGSEKFQNYKLVQQAVAIEYVQLLNASAPTSALTAPAYWFNVDTTLKSALQFWYPSYQDASAFVANGAPVYLYSFDYVNFNISALGWTGATHASDLYFVFGYVFIQPPMANQYNANMTMFETTMWTNFVKFGNPTPAGSPVTWTPLTNLAAGNYLSINSPMPTMQQGYRNDTLAFWSGTIASIQTYGAGVCTGAAACSPANFCTLFCASVAPSSTSISPTSTTSGGTGMRTYSGPVDRCAFAMVMLKLLACLLGY